MKINRTNYLIWFERLAGNVLSEKEIEELAAFLNHNPDLQDELSEPCDDIPVPVISFPEKEKLKRTIADLSMPQFEHLCIAYMEDDLSPEQKAEIEGINDADKLKTFELIRKTKLIAPEIVYRNKKRLNKSTTSRRISAFTIITLAAAAVTAIILLTMPFRTNIIPEATTRVAGNRGSLKQPYSGPGDSVSKTLQKPPLAEKSQISGTGKKTPSESTIAFSGNIDSTVQIRRAAVVPEKITFKSNPGLKQDPADGLLAGSPHFIVPDTDYETTRVGRFIARNFREKIMKEKTNDESPLKSYELAEAGITGLNKLLGWDMALTRNTNENGDLISLRFSSKILKFNAPVKNNSSSR
jgi:hypothetical protein